MRTSEAGKNMIKKFEGCRLTAYRDGNSYSIGYGHNGVSAGAKITQAQAESYFESDIVKFENAVNDLQVPLSQNQFDALVSFTYNVGTAAMSGSTLAKKVKANANDSTIYQEFMKWVYYQGAVNKNLQERREKEANVYFDTDLIKKKLPSD